jgi:hypothetical protein
VNGYAYITWKDEGGARALAHPWCAFWTVKLDDAPELTSGDLWECRQCGRRLPLRRAGERLSS